MEINLAISGLDELVGLLGCFGILNSLHLPLLLLGVGKSWIIVGVSGNPTKQFGANSWCFQKNLEEYDIFWGFTIPLRPLPPGLLYLFWMTSPDATSAQLRVEIPVLEQNPKSNWYEIHWNTTQTLIFNIHDIHTILKISISSKNFLVHHVWYPFILDH